MTLRDQNKKLHALYQTLLNTNTKQAMELGWLRTRLAQYEGTDLKKALDNAVYLEGQRIEDFNDLDKLKSQAEDLAVRIRKIWGK